jgi:uncharacterized protein
MTKRNGTRTEQLKPCSERLAVAVLADTHVRDPAKDSLPREAWDRVSVADVVLHAGDITSAGFLEALHACARVHAVRGNNDTNLPHLPETLELALGDVRIAMIHDSGPRKGRETRMHRRFPGADLVVFGHSHIPWDATGVDGQRLFNPGSARLRRRQPYRTMGFITVEARCFNTELVVLP